MFAACPIIEGMVGESAERGCDILIVLPQQHHPRGEEGAGILVGGSIP